MAEFGARVADSQLERLVLVEFPGDPLACRYNGTSTDVLTGTKYKYCSNAALCMSRVPRLSSCLQVQQYKY